MPVYEFITTKERIFKVVKVWLETIEGENPGYKTNINITLHTAIEIHRICNLFKYIANWEIIIHHPWSFLSIDTQLPIIINRIFLQLSSFTCYPTRGESQLVGKISSPPTQVTNTPPKQIIRLKATNYIVRLLHYSTFTLKRKPPHQNLFHRRRYM